MLDNKKLSIQIAPNPFRGSLYLNIGTVMANKSNITITSLQGKVLVQKKLYLAEGDNHLIIDETNLLSNGLYLLTVTVGNDKKSINIVKE